VCHQTHRLLVTYFLRNISICGSVISTEASHSFTVRGTVEKSASLPKSDSPGRTADSSTSLRSGRNDISK
jgi:hypothetical protein